MPLLTRWYIRSALVYLVAALLLAVVLALPNAINLPPFILFMNPAYFHLFLVGWVTQMIFGVIYWMFPIITRARPRGNEQLVGPATSYGLFPEKGRNLQTGMQSKGHPLYPLEAGL